MLSASAGAQALRRHPVWVSEITMRTRIMYIESKAAGLTGPARIGRVSLSKTSRTLYYGGKAFQSLKGAGFKSNYYDVETGEEYTESLAHAETAVTDSMEKPRRWRSTKTCARSTGLRSGANRPASARRSRTGNCGQLRSRRATTSCRSNVAAGRPSSGSTTSSSGYSL